MVKPEASSDTTFQIIKKALLPDNGYIVGFNEKELNNLVA